MFLLTGCSHLTDGFYYIVNYRDGHCGLPEVLKMDSQHATLSKLSNRFGHVLLL